MKKYLLLTALLAAPVMAAPNIYGGMSFQNNVSGDYDKSMPALNIGVEVSLTDVTSVSIETGYERIVDDASSPVVKYNGVNYAAYKTVVVHNFPLVAKYNFKMTDKWTISPLAGITYSMSDIDTYLKKLKKNISNDDSTTGGVIGLETSYKVRDDLSLNLGYKFTRSELSGVNSEYRTAYAGFNFHF